MSHRVAQVNELLRRELSQLIGAEVEFSPGVLVTITQVVTSADLQNATVWVSVLPTTASDTAIQRLHRQARALYAGLFRTVRFRPVPALHFRSDDTEARAADIEQLLDQLPESGA